MASVLDEMMSELAVPAHLDQMGDTVRFISANSERNITAVVTRKNALIKEDSNHSSIQTVLVVTTSYDADGITTINLGDYVRYDSVQWDYQMTREVGGGFITVQFLKTAITQYGKRPSQL